MHLPRIERAKVGDRGVGRNLAIERVQCFQCDLLSFTDLECGGDVGMIAVVAAVRFVAKRLATVDAVACIARFPTKPTAGLHRADCCNSRLFSA